MSLDRESNFRTEILKDIEYLGLARIYYGYWLLAARNSGLALVTSARLPTIYGIREFAMAGGLMFLTSLPDFYRSEARLVD